MTGLQVVNRFRTTIFACWRTHLVEELQETSVQCSLKVPVSYGYRQSGHSRTRQQHAHPAKTKTKKVKSLF